MKDTASPYPFDIHFIPQEVLGRHGQLGMTATPGRKKRGARGLPEKRLKEEEGAEVLVSLMGREEYEDFGIARAASDSTIHNPHRPRPGQSAPYLSPSRPWESLRLRRAISTL